MPSRLCPAMKQRAAEAVTVNSVTISAYSAAVYAPAEQRAKRGIGFLRQRGKRLFFGFGVRRLLTGSGSPRRAAHRAAAPLFFMPCKSAAPPGYTASGGAVFQFVCAYAVRSKARPPQARGGKPKTHVARRTAAAGALRQYICPRHGAKQPSVHPPRPALESANPPRAKRRVRGTAVPPRAPRALCFFKKCGNHTTFVKGEAPVPPGAYRAFTCIRQAGTLHHKLFVRFLFGRGKLSGARVLALPGAAPPRAGRCLPG